MGRDETAYIGRRKARRYFIVKDTNIDSIYSLMFVCSWGWDKLPIFKENTILR
jgi:hypothetical protein